MDLDEFREYYINDINSQAAAEARYNAEVFIDDVADMLIHDFAMIQDLEHCFFSVEKGTRAFKSMYIDAGSLDLTTNTMNLLLADFNGEDMVDLNQAFILSKSTLLINFFDNVLKDFFAKAEQTTATAQLAYDIKQNYDSIYKLHLFVISTNKMKETIQTLALPDVIYKDCTFKVELDVIDIVKIKNTKLADQEKEDIVLDTKDFGFAGIPCIPADVNSERYDAYLSVVPGKFLADIYKKHGSRLLSGNVRSFLQLRGVVNKGIRNTTIHGKEEFFAYNNGISTTAKGVEVAEVEGKGLCITRFTDLQIINGGQTTAALAYTSIKDSADLEGIFVQMKLTIVKGEDPDFVRNISKFANTQNKVTATDLSSNHPFYVKIEELSNRLFAPTVANQMYQTIWFFERSRGQYDQGKMKMTKGEQKVYERVHPKSQKFTKTELAKWENSAQMRPFFVAWGAEVNAVRFQGIMEKSWDEDSSAFDELYFKELVAKGILFKTMEKMISSQDWYQENKGNRAQLVTYSVAKTISETRKLGKFFNYLALWEKQSVPEFLMKDFEKVAKIVYDTFNKSDRPVSDIREYCKRESCWKNVDDSHFSFSPETQAFFKEEAQSKTEYKKERIKEQTSTLEKDIHEVGVVKWKELLSYGVEEILLTAKEEGLLKFAVDYCNGIQKMTRVKATAIWKLKEKLESHQDEI